jgi:hypothetical protein
MSQISAANSLLALARAQNKVQGWLLVIVINHYIACIQLILHMIEITPIQAKILSSLFKRSSDIHVAALAGLIVMVPYIVWGLVVFLGIMTSLKLLLFKPSAPRALRNFNYMLIVGGAVDIGFSAIMGKNLGSAVGWGLFNGFIAALVIAYTHRSVRLHQTYDLP